MKTNQKISIVGIGMGNRNTLTIEAYETICAADCLIGAKRLLDIFCDLNVPKTAMIAAEKISDYIHNHPAYSHIVILMSGDVGFYSGATLLAPQLEQYSVKFYPGISSLQYLSARLGLPWNDTKIVSLHGRHENLIAAVNTNEKTFVLTGGESTVQSVCQQLCDAGFSNAFVTVGENLSYPNERVVSGFAETFINGDFVNLSVMLIQNKEPQKKYLAVHGLPDEAFLRGDVPMTKSEIRSVSISKLQLKEDDVLFDVGAGTGSISIEAGLVLSQGTVYAIEKKEEAMLLIENNIARFSLKNVYVVCGKAPEAFEPLPIPTKVFIGGSSGNMKEIIAALLARNSKIRIVINIIALETLSAALDALKECGLQNTEVVQLSVSKSKQLGGYHMMVGQNPIYIITAEGNSEL